ncbi:MAG: peptidoglycan-binding protein [Syntrophomonadaceae bacterium]|nr:peptidoglycan-binding protein [Syntrophomonadaceae bacterium]
MRKGGTVFLILVVSAAVMAGTTLGLVRNWQYLTTPRVQKEPIPEVTESHPVPSETGTEAPVTRQQFPAVASSETGPLTGADQNLSLILTREEVQEINSMLLELGYSSTSLTEGLKEFQRQNRLIVSGYVDGPTLQALVRQLTLKRVRTST